MMTFFGRSEAWISLMMMMMMAKRCCCFDFVSQRMAMEQDVGLPFFSR
jgi:hypothetical protein